MNISGILQIIVAIGLLNVWLLRKNKSTSYRGGDSKSLKEEFASYGLPSWVYFLVGALKISSAVALIVGLWFSPAGYYASILVSGLMLGALAMHIKIKDPLKKSIPALLMLAMSLTIALTI